MKFKRLILMLIIAAVAISMISSVSAAVKIHNSDLNKNGDYGDGNKKISGSSGKGYNYHSGKLHKNPKLNSDDIPYCYNGKNKQCKWHGRTDIGLWYVTGTVSEMKKVSYGSIKINGKYHNKKVKLYNDERFEGTAKFPSYYPTNLVKGNLKGKTVTLNAHDKNGKVLATKSFKINKVNTYYWIGE
jgi:hypothetical protein